MTEKIYQKDAYLREWDAELIRIEDGGWSGCFHLYDFCSGSRRAAL